MCIPAMSGFSGFDSVNEDSRPDGLEEAKDDWVCTGSSVVVTKIKRKKCVVCKQLCPEDVSHDCTALREQKSEFARLFRCHRCGDIFTPMSSLGQHQCSWHPGDYIDNQWTCCGRTKRDVTSRYVFNGLWSRRNHQPTYPRDPPGCTPCDHFNRNIPTNASAFGKDVDIQKDLPFAVMCNLVPGPTKRPGWRTKCVISGGRVDKIGVLTASEESPAVKKRRLNADYSFVIEEVKEDDDEGPPQREAFTLKHRQSFIDLQDVEHTDFQWNVEGWKCLLRNTGEEIDLEETIGELIKKYGLVSGEVFLPFRLKLESDFGFDEDGDDLDEAEKEEEGGGGSSPEAEKEEEGGGGGGGGGSSSP